ncbi:MAG: TatD family hydrolase [Chitinispirillales bacterium]|jgi:TatD DNase family protein|nr:TatD family hydrolase [Chitinispirillales bacterium]
MFDTHCHLQDDRISAKAGDIVAAANRAGVTGMLCCGSSAADWGGVERIGAAYAGGGVVCAYGVHPFYAGSVDIDGNNWADELSGRLAGDPSAAVGEIGLDHTVSPRGDDRQAELFARQLKIAERYGRPVSIHCRKAFGVMLSILRDNGGLKFGGALHSYGGPPDLIDELVGLGCHISFSGSILNPNGKRAFASLKKVPVNRLLIETDSPGLLPRGAAGPFNEPANLSLILNRAAEILGESSRKIAELTNENGCRLYRQNSY